MVRTDFAWSLRLVGERQSRKLSELMEGLQGEDGQEKRIVSGYSYWGLESSLAWYRASTDVSYSVTYDGIATFANRWERTHRALDGRGYHYISLGPGTGEKDRAIIAELQPQNPNMFYVPVDISAEMLSICLLPMETLPFFAEFKRQILPVQLDLALDHNLDALARLRDELVGDEPVIFSLLGNTMANFDDDLELIERLGSHLLQPQDRLLVEVATTPTISPEAATYAASEYAGSKSFREFVTTALREHTDLSVSMDDVLFVGDSEDGRAVMVRIYYRNAAGKDLRMSLNDGREIKFADGDRIRLYLSRKYEVDRLVRALNQLDFSVLNQCNTTFPRRRGPKSLPFGLSLLTLSTERGADEAQASSSADVFNEVQ